MPPNRMVIKFDATIKTIPAFSSFVNVLYSLYTLVAVKKTMCELPNNIKVAKGINIKAKTSKNKPMFIVSIREARLF